MVPATFVFLVCIIINLSLLSSAQNQYYSGPVIPSSNLSVAAAAPGGVGECGGGLSSAKIDLFFIVDSSSSVHEGNFTKMLEFVASIVEKLTVSENDTRIGFLQYSSKNKLEFSLNTYNTKAGVLEHLRNVHYMTGVTYTGQAIRQVLDYEFVPEKGYRHQVPNVIIVMTDGLAQDDVLPPSNRARDQGIVVFSIGITYEVGQRQLLEITGYRRDRVFLLDDFDSFNEILSSIEHEMENSVAEECKKSHTYGTGSTTAGYYVVPWGHTGTPSGYDGSSSGDGGSSSGEGAAGYGRQGGAGTTPAISGSSGDGGAGHAYQNGAGASAGYGGSSGGGVDQQGGAGNGIDYGNAGGGQTGYGQGSGYGGGSAQNSGAKINSVYGTGSGPSGSNNVYTSTTSRFPVTTIGSTQPGTARHSYPVSEASTGTSQSPTASTASSAASSASTVPKSAASTSQTSTASAAQKSTSSPVPKFTLPKSTARTTPDVERFGLEVARVSLSTKSAPSGSGAATVQAGFGFSVPISPSPINATVITVTAPTATGYSSLDTTSTTALHSPGPPSIRVTRISTPRIPYPEPGPSRQSPAANGYDGPNAANTVSPLNGPDNHSSSPLILNGSIPDSSYVAPEGSGYGRTPLGLNGSYPVPEPEPKRTVASGYNVIPWGSNRTVNGTGPETSYGGPQNLGQGYYSQGTSSQGVRSNGTGLESNGTSGASGGNGISSNGTSSASSGTFAASSGTGSAPNATGPASHIGVSGTSMSPQAIAVTNISLINVTVNIVTSTVPANIRVGQNSSTLSPDSLRSVSIAGVGNTTDGHLVSSSAYGNENSTNGHTSVTTSLYAASQVPAIYGPPGISPSGSTVSSTPSAGIGYPGAPSSGNGPPLPPSPPPGGYSGNGPPLPPSPPPGGYYSGNNGREEGVEIRCDDGRIQLALSTPSGKEFTGWAFVKGHFEDQSCRFDFQNNTEQHIFVLLKYDKCGIMRQRSSSPPGLSFSTTIVFMRHRQFLTDGDRAYRLQCFYMESEKRVTQTLEVSMFTTKTIDVNAEMPACQYTLREGKLQGPQVKTAVVGMKVVHRWDCEAGMNAADVYGIKVHTCYAKNYDGRQALIVDESGCAVDKYVLDNLKYTDDLMTAYVESNVFKFADSNQVFFDCQISICVKIGGGCNGVSPPNCFNSSRGKRSANDNDQLDTSQPYHSFDLVGETVFVVDTMFDGTNALEPSAIGHIGATLIPRRESLSSNRQYLPLRRSTVGPYDICLTRASFLFGTISLVCATSVTSVLCIFLMCLRFRRARRKL